MEVIQFLVVFFVFFSLVISFGPHAEQLKKVSFIHLYLFVIWITGYRKCNFTYIELKLRECEYSEGYFYSLLNSIYDLRSLWLIIPEFFLLYNINKV